ncbi:hypothetical protein BDZ97DRAFT_761496 [Flammula alnicola]|nr:hypothetical protein BDZ97DRAFT_761496 [Flammula alnicola]
MQTNWLNGSLIRSSRRSCPSCLSRTNFPSLRIARVIRIVRVVRVTRVHRVVRPVCTFRWFTRSASLRLRSWSIRSAVLRLRIIEFCVEVSSFLLLSPLGPGAARAIASAAITSFYGCSRRAPHVVLLEHLDWLGRYTSEESDDHEEDEDAS